MRTKGMGALEEDIQREAVAIFNDFEQFTTGTRYISLLHRSKDGGHNKEYHRRGGFFITHSPEEYLDALVRLLTLQTVASKPYRLYASVNPRSIEKGEKQFKMDMLEADFASKENKDFFYSRLQSRWASSLMKPGSRTQSLFMFDLDNPEGLADPVAPLLIWLSKRADKVQIIKQYKTPNGYHVITTPFNPEGLDVPNCEVKKDGLLLLKG